MRKYVCDFCGVEKTEKDLKFISHQNDDKIWGYLLERNEEKQILSIEHARFNECENHICYKCFFKFYEWESKTKGLEDGRSDKEKNKSIDE